MSERGKDPEARAGREEDPASRMDREHLQKMQRARRARVAKAMVIVAVVVLLIIFVIQNSDPVPVDFVFVTRSPRLIWVLVVTALLGGLVGYLLGRPSKETRMHRDDQGKKKG